jgi:hypothetical protein
MLRAISITRPAVLALEGIDILANDQINSIILLVEKP